MNSEKIIHLQEKLAKKVISKDVLPSAIKTICGVDVSYKGNKAYCSAIVLSRKSFRNLRLKLMLILPKK